MTRKEIYAYIKDNGIGKEISTKLGYSWTNAKTDILEQFINSTQAQKETDNDNCDQQETIEYGCVDCYNAIVTMLANLPKEVMESIVKEANSLRDIVNNINK